MPLDLILNNGFASSSFQTETSSFPYNGIGPIDFSQLNLVKTQQTDYYYDTVGSGTTEYLISKVTQTYDPIEAMLLIALLISLFFAALGFGIYKIRKMGK